MAQTDVHIFSDFATRNDLNQQILPNGDIRFFVRTDGHTFWGEGNAALIDITPQYDFTQQGYIHIYPFIHASSYQQTFEEGSSIAAYNFFECDYLYKTTILRYDITGDTLWSINIEGDFPWIKKMVLVAPEIVCLFREIDTLYVNLEGELISYTPTIYFDHVVQHSSGYIASLDTKLFTLDDLFSVITQKELGDTITSLRFINDEVLQVTGMLEVYLFDSELNDIGWDPAIHDGESVLASENYYWDLGSSEVYKLDQSFQLLDILPVDDDVKLKTGFGKDGRVTVIGIYFWGEHPVVFQAAEDQISFLLNADAGVSGISFTDSVFIKATPYGALPANDFYFPPIYVEVSNFSSDTLKSYTILYEEYTVCDNCHYFRHEWKVDTLPIPPLASVQVLIDSFLLICSDIENNQICLRTVLENQEPDTENTNNYFCAQFDVNSGLPHSGQHENHLLHPLLSDFFYEYQVLPNGNLRLFNTSDLGLENHAREAVFMDIKRGEALSQVQIKLVDSDQNWYQNSPGLKTLLFKNGHSLVGTSLEGCDVVPPGGIVKLSDDGEQEWLYEFAVDFYGLEKIVFVDSNVIYVSSEGINYAMIDREGNELSLSEPLFIYDQTIETSFGYLARYENRIDILFPSFELFQSYPLPEMIRWIKPLPNGAFLIRAGNSHYRIDKFKQLTNLEITMDDEDIFWPSNNYYWVYKKDQSNLIKLSQHGDAIDTSNVPVGITPLFGLSANDSIVSVASSITDVNDGIVVYRGKEETFHLGIPRDLSIVNVEIPDSVVVEYINSSTFNGGWIHHYDFVNVDIQNVGTDTVSRFTIQSQDVSGCFMCDQNYHYWSIDSVLLAPNEIARIELGSFVPMCLYSEPGSLCLSVISPNDEADANYLNDKYCEPYSLLIGTSNPNEIPQLSIFPNPAYDLVYFNLEQHTYENLTCTVYNASGSITDQFKVNEYSHSVNEYLPGIYLFQLRDQSGVVGYQRILKLNK